ncbi:MAG: hypothetical protein CK426_08445 [Legionella sp.]|nr:MAG: hypothetical protein CK423_01350 [Legionella sp.]PJD97456.1 MAG: hypothetical protein CK426_08445 [Legionella sp.]
MKFSKAFMAMMCFSLPLYAVEDVQLQKQINALKQQTEALQEKLNHLQANVSQNKKRSMPVQKKTATAKDSSAPDVAQKSRNKTENFHSSELMVHVPDAHPESIGFYPTALVADNNVVTYIAGTPVVSSPYLGDRPAFDGSDYIVNISSINRDIRLMQQRRRLYRAYQQIGYPIPEMPIIAVSGKVEPMATIGNPYLGQTDGDLTLGSSEIDFAAALNQNVEGYIAVAYDESPPSVGPRINNSSFHLNMGFVNIGNLDKTPFYFTAGQIYVPFGRYSSSMISAPLTMNVARTKTRPFILGYKSQENTGPFAAVYGYKSDTTLGQSGIGGYNLGYIFAHNEITGEVGTSLISSVDDAAGMQGTASIPGTTFGGFGSLTNGNESVRKTPAFDIYGNIAFDRYNFYAEWLTATERFRTQDLSMNGQGAKPQAGQVEANMTFKAFDRPASLGLGYQWTKDALALNLPQQRYVGVFNISIWKDTVESLEYRHDIDYAANQYANGANSALANFPPNQNTVGTGKGADTISAQIGVYF